MIRPRWTLPAACAVGVFTAFMIVTGAAAATTPTLVADPTSGPGGTTVALLGRGFCVSCGVVEIDFAARLVKRSIVVGADGSFQTTFVVPGGAQAGTNAINAYQQGVLVTQTAFEVTPSIPAPTGQPPTLSPQPTATPAQSPRNTPTATPTPNPTRQPSPASSGGGGSPSPAAVAGLGDFPIGLFVAIVIVLAVAGASITVVWWQRRRT
jgi:hypothetical protein